MLRSIRFFLSIVLFLHFVLSHQGFAQHTSYSEADSQIAVAVNDTIVLRLGDYVGEFVQWQNSSDMVIWLDIPEANSDTLTFSSDINTAIYFRAKVVAGCCDPFISSSILVEVFNHSHLNTTAVSGITAISANSGGTIINDGGTPISARGVIWGTWENPSIDNNLGITNNGNGTGTFDSELAGLTQNTNYYVRAYATTLIGTSYGQQLSFTTLNGEVLLTTAPISNITSSSAESGGNISSDGGATVTARGLVWGISTNPTISSNNGYTVNGSGTGSWVSEMLGLNPGTTYYERSYATNSIGTFYGDEVTFTTLAALPQVATNEVTSITATTAVSGGEVTYDGGATVTARGIVWSASENPTLDDNDGFTQNGSGTGTWVSNLTELSPNTTYYVRAYATNSAGTQYGNQQNFTTLAAFPQVTTTEVSSITATTAVSGGEVTNDGGATVTARGVCWSTSQNPTTNDSYTEDGTGTGSYVSSVTELIPNTTYYLCAYATNSAGTAYGNEISFSTLQLAPVANFSADITTGQTPLTVQFTDLSTNTPTSWSWDFGDGNTSDAQNPQHTYTNQGIYTVALTATNAGGSHTETKAGYITVNLVPVLPTVTTTDVSDIMAYTATSGGNVTHNGNANITARGVCWSTSQNPTTNDSHTEDGTGTGSYISSVTELIPNTTYYLRAYATNSVGTAYGDEVSFSTLQLAPVANFSADVTTGQVPLTVQFTDLSTNTPTSWSWDFGDGNSSSIQNPEHTYNEQGTFTVSLTVSNTGGSNTETKTDYITVTLTPILPTVTTNDITNIGAYSATSGGNVTHNGNADITARGVCWSTSQNPTIIDSHTTDGTGTGTFTSTITELLPNTTYYLRAYATNSVGTAYGEQKTFTTATTPTVLTADITNILTTTATGGGNVTASGGVAVTAKGVVWSTSQNPTITSNLGITNDGTGTGSFVSELTELTAGTTYYVRAYATNEAGTAYGAEKTFVTLALPTITTTAISNLASTSITSGGNITSNGGAAVTARGVCYGTTSNPTLENNFTVDGTGIGVFVSNLSELTPSTTYYIRAYATSIAGTAYGNQVTFNTISTTQIADIDNNVYNTVTIGDQVWMKENLKTTKFRNGVSIPNISNDSQWSSQSSFAYSVYDNNSSNGVVYGNLYNAFAFFSEHGLCPTGWKRPNYDDWAELSNFLGGYEVAGGKMKEAGYMHWQSPNTGATNESGFTALPSGRRTPTGLYTALTTDATYGKLWLGPDNQWSSVNLYYNNVVTQLAGSIGLQNGFAVRCIQGEDYFLPIVITSYITNITTNTANCYANVDNKSGIVTERGFYYSTNPIAETNGIKVIVGSGTSGYNTTLTGLTPATTYYLKAYAVNSAGVVFGEELTFTTLPNAEPIFDIDGNEYSTKNYGTQIWMTENLRTSKYRNGDDVPNLILAADWGSTTAGAWCYHNNNEANNVPFGKLYNFYTTLDERNLCPEGWHVPTQQEWIILVQHLGGLDVAGGKMKVEGFTYWENPNTGASNESGFNAYGAGDRTQQGDYFGPMTYSCAWWSTTIPTAYPTTGYNTILNHTSAGANYNYNSVKNRGISVRCARDLGLQETNPTISTNEVTNITNNSATSGGNVTNSGGSTVIARGVVWSTTENPTLESNNGFTEDGTGAGEFVSELTGLTPNTTYYVRAYATNSVGTGYGEQISFVTLHPWNQMADIGVSGRLQAVGLSIGNKGYIGLGYSNNQYQNDFWEYDPSTNTWSQKADFGGTSRGNAVSFSINNKAYVGTGYDNTFRKDFWEYDPSTNTWTQKADFGGDGPGRDHAVGFSIGDKGYVGTGYYTSGSPSVTTRCKDFWGYNPTSNSWTQKADVGDYPRTAAVGFSIDGKGYIGTGLKPTGPNTNERIKDFWEYDPVSNIWSQKADLTGNAREHAVGFSINGKGYIGTGGSTRQKDLWEYNPANNSWVEKSELTGESRWFGVGFSIGNYGYIGTGQNEANVNLNDFWRFQPNSD